ncbi:hypothetical protein MUP77_06415 [Candidatus Bathyarchaeota archaeon]|nr:hypothetical protein [Candidatus Bathyarchaeota archaeon]
MIRHILNMTARANGAKDAFDRFRGQGFSQVGKRAQANLTVYRSPNSITAQVFNKGKLLRSHSV